MKKQDDLILSSIGLTYRSGLFPVRFPIIIYLKITNRCMLNCNFCSQDAKVLNDMHLTFMKKHLFKLREGGVEYLYITGGEPLLHPNIREISEYACDLGFQLVLVTNGLLLDDNRMDILKYYVALGVSLHGSEKMHDNLTGKPGCYRNVISNLENVRKKYPLLDINLNFTATSANLDLCEFKIVAEICEKYGFNMSVARLNYIGKGARSDLIDVNIIAENIDSLVKLGYNVRFSNCVASCLLKKEYKYLSYGCGAGHTMAAIETNGDVKICASSNYAIGNLHDQEFEKLWKNDKVNKYRSFSWIPFSCKMCSDLAKCKAGCKAEIRGLFWKELSDCSVRALFHNVWRDICDKKIVLNFSSIRKEKNGYITISAPVRYFNDNVKRIIEHIDGSLTGTDIVNMFSKTYKKDILIDLLVSLKADSLIRTVDEIESD